MSLQQNSRPAEHAVAEWAGRVAVALGAVAISGGAASAQIVTPIVINGVTEFDLLSDIGLPTGAFGAILVDDTAYNTNGASSINAVALDPVLSSIVQEPIALKFATAPTLTPDLFTATNSVAVIKYPQPTEPFYVPVLLNDPQPGWLEFQTDTTNPDQLDYVTSSYDVPEPGSLGLLAIGAAAAAAIRRRKTSAAN